MNLSKSYKQIVIIDDFSIDYTYEELITFININKLDNVEITQNIKNMGPSFTRNRGLIKAKGKYIAFLDSDDDWHPQKIELQVRIMEKYNVKICGTMHKVILKEEINHENSNDYLKYDNIPVSIVQWPKILFISPFATPSIVIHNSLKNYLFDESIRFSEDYNLWKRITYKHKAIKILLPLTYTFKHDYIGIGDSLSTNLNKMQLGVEHSFLSLIKSKEIALKDKPILIIALAFSEVKYVRRLLKNKIDMVVSK